MTKAALLPVGLFLLLALALRPATAGAQTTSTDYAVNQAILNQANTILLRQKLVEARSAVSHGDLVNGAKLYQDAYGLVEQIGQSSDIKEETAQTISGLVSVRLEL